MNSSYSQQSLFLQRPSEYLQRIYRARNFWTHLVLSDLRTKYRRSFLGITWAVVHPLLLTLLLGFVMSRVFHSPLADYAPYIFSGLILWEFIITAAVTGCHAFINAESYIRQFVHPMAIYSLRTTLAGLINLGFAFIGLLVWIVMWRPENINATWLTLPFAFLTFFLVGWPLATIAAFTAVRFRDFSQMTVLILQAIWYVSPVFFLPRVFEGAKIRYVLDYNPIYHLLCLFRAPLLQGELPTLMNYVFSLATALFLGAIAAMLIKFSEKRVIFYL